jgi:hypothetical protein
MNEMAKKGEETIEISEDQFKIFLASLEDSKLAIIDALEAGYTIVGRPEGEEEEEEEEEEPTPKKKKKVVEEEEEPEEAEEEEEAPDDLDDMNLKQLLAVAEENEIEIPSKVAKSEDRTRQFLEEALREMGLITDDEGEEEEEEEPTPKKKKKVVEEEEEPEEAEEEEGEEEAPRKKKSEKISEKVRAKLQKKVKGRR